jgi:hypothetical protein
MRRWVVVVASLALGGNCDPPELPKPVPDAAPVAAHFPADQRAQAIADGRATIVHHQCTRCHVIDDIPPGPRALHCTSCHEFLKGLKPTDKQYKEIASHYGQNIIERYQRNIWHLQRVPDLTDVGKRLRPDWIVTFLAEPFDVRPVLTESMIRHKLSPDEITKVARYFAAVADVPADPPPRPEHAKEAEINAGRTLLVDKGCGKCHVFGNVPLGSSRADLEASYGTALLAPNLRFAGARMRPETIAKWIQGPQAFQKTATMPAQQVTDDEAAKIASFLVWGEPQLGPIPAPRMPDVHPSPTPVAWEDVKERVLGRICVHCHMNDYEKDKGPGNKGGFGYVGVGMKIRTYESIVWGAEGTNGERYSILIPRNGEPYAPVVMAMLRRRVEAARDQVAAYDDHERPDYPSGWLPGMPLGLPAMTDEEIGIVERWIEDGCPGPTKVTGMAGVYDGFLVPDGPIAKNKGCELRPASKARPAWTTLTEKKGAEGALEPLK